MLHTILCFFSSAWYSSLAYWLPLSECSSTPSAGFLCPCAMINAWQTSSARMCDSIAQPITRREHRSITTAR